MAISAATTPPPMMARLAGTCWTLVASRLVHGFASRRPSMSGISGSDPVATVTACLAVRTRTVPSAAVTVTCLGPVIWPWPRARAIPAPSIHCTWLSSFQSLVKVLRRLRTAGTSSLPVTASAAPGTAWAARSACADRSSTFDGMQAQ